MARSAVLVVLVSVAAAPPPDVAGPELKCRRSVQLPGYPEDELVLLIDGELIRPGPGQTLEEHLAERDDIGADDIDAVEVTCWHPERNAFGLGAGLPVVRVRTKSLVSSTRAPLEALIRAQEAYAAEHGDHAGALLDLLAYGLPRDLEIDFAASEKGWEASTADGPVAYHCTASFRATGERAPGVVEEGRGSAEEAPEAVHGPGRARIACDTRDELEIQVLREAFEAHG